MAAQKVFVAMPFAREFAPVYDAIKGAAARNGIQTVRVDEVLEPGPIIAQVTREIGDADFVIAEVSSKNPNVYYEVGLAHCSRKPTLLLATSDSLDSLPFDIRHNRVITYDRRKPSSLEESVFNHLQYLRYHYVTEGSPPTLGVYMGTLSEGRQGSNESIEHYVKTVAHEFDLKGARLVESRFSPGEGFILTIQDSFGDRVVFDVDINGLIRRKKKIN